ncbi:hypothetical protein J3R83DRAFT_4273 [Lanmaoa asiatica]|nr:hypothetical protein J3R83DRAFT_4273 [Lanmaoa asiatica]
MLSFICFTLLLPLGVLSRPLTLATSVSCVIADLNYPNPHETLVLLNRRVIAPPPGLSKRTFTDLLIWCHEYGHSTSGMLLARQNPSCPAGTGGGDNQGAVGPASSAGGGSGSGAGSNGTTASSASGSGISGANNGAPSSGSGSTGSASSGSASNGTNGQATAATSVNTASATTTSITSSTTTTTSATSTSTVSATASVSACPPGQTASVAATLTSLSCQPTFFWLVHTNFSFSNTLLLDREMKMRLPWSLLARGAPRILVMSDSHIFSALQHIYYVVKFDRVCPNVIDRAYLHDDLRMDAHFAVLPLDVIDTVVSRLHDSTARLPRFLRLPHPRTGIASLFLAHEPVPDEDEPDRSQVSKILEVQAVEPPNARSWFIGEEVISDGKLLVMTPVDPLFLLIPLLRAIKQPDAANFRPADDIFEDAARHIAEVSMVDATQDTSVSVGVEDIMKFAALECTKKAMKRLCDVKGKPDEITTDITVFRYSSEKLIQELRKKAVTLSTTRITELSRCLVRSLAKDALMEDKNEDLLELGRTKLACELLGQYLPHDIQRELLTSYEYVPGTIVTSDADADTAGLAWKDLTRT